LFAGSGKGGERAAAIYSLIEAAKLNGLDPELYLREVQSCIANHLVNRIRELLPWNLIPSQAPASTLTQAAAVAYGESIRRRVPTSFAVGNPVILRGGESIFG
jgi:hypothetical protein